MNLNPCTADEPAGASGQTSRLRHALRRLAGARPRTDHTEDQVALRAAEAARARLVRDLHDGAQQRLVHTVITLKLAQRTLQAGGNAQALVAQALRHAEQGLDELRDLAHGVTPRAVTRGGLRGGVEALAAHVPLAVEIDIAADGLAPAYAANAYFVVAEALTNVVKHADARSVAIHAHVAHHTLHIEVRDDGRGGVRADGGAGLRGMRDRVESLGGRLRIESPPGQGTLIAVRLPLTGTAARAQARHPVPA